MPPSRIVEPPRRWPTIALWTIVALNLAAGGLAAGALVLIPTSFDPVETISAGAAPWVDAAYAALAFLGLLVASAITLALWHSRRFRRFGALLAGVLALCVAWACASVYTEYF